MRMFRERRRSQPEHQEAASGHCRQDEQCQGADAAHRCPACTAVVARQPIFDRNLAVSGYELLYRSLGETSARFDDAVAATAQVIVGATLDVGVKHLSGTLPCFINFPRDLLVSPLQPPIEPGRVVIEVLEDVQPDPELLRSLAVLRRAGYRIALDDFQPRQGSEALLAQADIVKLDIQMYTPDHLAALARSLRPARVVLIAEKVETRQELERCRELGFDGYQGYFLQRPETFSARRAPTDRLATLRLLLLLHDPEASVADIEAAIARDRGICYRVLRCINSGYYHWPHPIESIRQAIVKLGLDELRAICSAVLLAGFDDRPAYLGTQALVRARMCQTLCVNAGLQMGESYFLAGVLSLMDVLLGVSLRDALLTLPLSEFMRRALLGGEGQLGQALSCVQRYERGEWAKVRFQALPQFVIAQAYREAVGWAEELWRALCRAA